MDLTGILLGVFGVYVLAEVVAAVYIFRNRQKIFGQIRNLLGLNLDREERLVESMHNEYERLQQANFRADQDRKIMSIGKMTKKSLNNLNFLNE